MKKFLKQLLNKRLNNEKGLTLIELLAVIVILAIVAAIAVPAIGNIIDNSRAKALVADGVNVMNAANLYFTENPPTGTDKDISVSELIEKGFLESRGNLTETTAVTYATGGNTISGGGTNGSVSLTFPANTTLQFLTTAKVSVSDTGAVELTTTTKE